MLFFLEGYGVHEGSKGLYMLNKLKPKSEFSRNVLTLMTGTTIAQAIPIAISPILTRIYTPEDFGLLALYMSLLMIFGNIVAGKYELAILIPKNNNDAKHIVVYSIILSFIVSFILFLLVFIFNNEIMKVLDNIEIKVWLYILPLNIFIISTISILYYWNNRTKHYRKLSNNQILQSSIQGSSNLIIGTFYKINGGLLLGTILGGLSSLLYLILKTKADFIGFKFYKLKAISLIKKYIKFPKFMLPSGLLENFSSQLPIILLSSFFGSAIVGFYFLSQRLVKLPVALIGTSIGNVFRQVASEQLIKNGNCRNIFIRTLKKLIFIGTLPFIVFYFSAPMLFSFVFGQEWMIAGIYTQILTPMFYLQFITRPLSGMFIIAEKQQYDLIIQIYLLLGVWGAFFMGYNYFNSVEVSLKIFTFIYSIKYIFELSMSYMFTIKKD
jgi:O-antigen/teichoic acid export membrane protein